MKYCNGARKKGDKEGALPFSLRSATRKVKDYCNLEQIASSKAYLHTEGNADWMDGARLYKTNTKRVFITL